MDGFPSGQRGQTVNLLATLSVVRIHLHPLHESARSIEDAGVAELADAQDLKSCGTYLSYRFDSGLRHHINIAGWSSWQLVGLITRRSQVRVLPPQPNKYGPLVKRSRHRPFTAVTGVRFPYGSPIPGTIAQLGEHLPYKQGVTGSSPVSPTIRGLVVQLVRMPACHAGGRGFESLPGRQLN